MHNTGPILIAYDGSSSAQYAIDEAAMLAGSRKAVVVYVREPMEGLSAHLEGHPAFEEIRRLDDETLDAAERIAAAGAARAQAAGLEAEARVASTMTSTADAILEAADDVDASMIVLGSRGRRGIRSILLGSVSHHVLHHARRPALVIPSPDLADARRRVINEQPAQIAG